LIYKTPPATNQRRANTRKTRIADQGPTPRAVGIQRSFRPAAMARNDACVGRL